MQKLEDVAMKEWKKEQRLKIAMELAGNPPGLKDKKADKAKPAGKGKEPDKPVFDIPKLEVPKMTEFTSEGGNDYVRARPIE